jgi:hypothetical protein
MSDIKSIVSTIKILERTIGILENCNDIGEISDSTRKRVIEMLNKATLAIYFFDNNLSSEKTPEFDNAHEQKQIIADPIIENVVEKMTSDKTDEFQSDIKTFSEENISEDVIEENIFEEVTIDNLSKEEENIVENTFEDNTVSENDILNQPNPTYDKPLFEWELDKLDSTQKLQETDNKSNIDALKFQLEEERNRLEEELRNWQDEKRIRDEEIAAAKKLLESLQQQTVATHSNQQARQQPQPQPQLQQPQPKSQQPEPQPKQPQPKPQQPQPQPKQPQQSQEQLKSEPFIKPEFFKESQKNEEVQESISDHFVGKTKVLHENFEANNVVNQVSTPVSSLPKSIGINDRFRFIKELFGGDSDLYNDTIKILDNIGSLVSALLYIESNFSWDKNSDSVKQFISLIRRRYM